MPRVPDIIYKDKVSSGIVDFALNPCLFSLFFPFWSNFLMGLAHIFSELVKRVVILIYSVLLRVKNLISQIWIFPCSHMRDITG